MAPVCLLNTNVLLSAVSAAAAERTKRDIARAVLQGDDWTLSIQVLQEFVVQATRASRIQRSWRRANKRLHPSAHGGSERCRP